MMHCLHNTLLTGIRRSLHMTMGVLHYMNWTHFKMFVYPEIGVGGGD